MRFEITYDGIRGKHIVTNEKWNVVVKDKNDGGSIFPIGSQESWSIYSEDSFH